LLRWPGREDSRNREPRPRLRHGQRGRLRSGSLMGPLYAYSLVPVLSVAFLLFFTAALRGRNARGLAIYCLTIGVWTGALLCISFPKLAPLGERLAAIGAFTAASFLHAAYDVTAQRSYKLVVLAYLAALTITLLGVLRPGLLYGPLAMARGPFFWPAMA